MTKKILSLLIILLIVCSFADTACSAKRKSRRRTAQTQDVMKADSHNYYKGLTKAQAEEADRIAQDIARTLMSDKSLNSDLKKVRAAAKIVAMYCSRGVYGNDEKRYYRSPYGVFVAGVFTCAGATRALGRVFDFMGYDWQHVNENQWSHQWCILEMDGEIGFADGQAGLAGYGEHY